MAKTKTRRSGRKGLLSAIYRPVGEVIGAANNVSHTVVQSVDKIMHTGFSGANKIGRNVTSRADRIIYHVLPRGKGKKGKKRTTRRRKA